MEATANEILEAASGFEPDARATLTAGEMIQPKTFEGTFKSKGWPEFNGPVVVRYPNMADMLRIESMSLGGGQYAECFATFLVCVEKAPAAWYRMPEGAKEPVLNMGKLPPEDLLDLWGDFLKWRRSFRG